MINYHCDMNTTYNKSGDIQGVVISKHETDFNAALIGLIETIDEHQFYSAHFLNDNRIMIGQEDGNIVSIQIKYIEFISIDDDSIHIMCGQFSVAIEFAKAAFIIY